MQEAQFINIIESGKCPICNGRNINESRTPSGTKTISCSDCNGVPSLCNNIPFVNHAYNPSDFDTCPRCGEVPDSFTHVIYIRY